MGPCRINDVELLEVREGAEIEKIEIIEILVRVPASSRKHEVRDAGMIPEDADETLRLKFVVDCVKTLNFTRIAPHLVAPVEVAPVGWLEMHAINAAYNSPEPFGAELAYDFVEEQTFT